MGIEDKIEKQIEEVEDFSELLEYFDINDDYNNEEIRELEF